MDVSERAVFVTVIHYSSSQAGPHSGQSRQRTRSGTIDVDAEDEHRRRVFGLHALGWRFEPQR